MVTFLNGRINTKNRRNRSKTYLFKIIALSMLCLMNMTSCSIIAKIAQDADKKSQSEKKEIIEQKKSILFEAAVKGDVNTVKEVLAAGIDVNTTDEREDVVLDWHVDATPLHVATFYGNTNVVQALLASGADINKAVYRINSPGYRYSSVTSTTLTPLVFAVDKGNIDIVKELIAAGADINVKNLDNDHLLTAWILMPNMTMLEQTHPVARIFFPVL